MSRSLSQSRVLCSPKMKRAWVVLALVAAAMAGCGSDQAPARGGQEGFRCGENGSCDPGLTCASRLCVFVPDGGASLVDTAVDAPPPTPPQNGGQDSAAPPVDSAADAGEIENQAFSFDWQVEDVGLPHGDVVRCSDAGSTTVVLTVRNLASATPSQSFVFPCAAGSGITTTLDVGQYEITTRLLRADNIEVSATTFPGPGELPVYIDPGRVTDLGTIVFEIQTFTAQWAIARTVAPGVPVSCASAGAKTVEFTATKPPLFPFVFSFPCTDPQGITAAVPDGSYTLTFRLLNAANVALSQVTVPYVTPAHAQAVLQPVTFVVN